MTINERIEARIKERGMTKKQVAQELKIPYSTFSSYLNLGRDIPAQLIAPLATILWCSAYYLLTGQEGPIESPPIRELSRNEEEMVELYRRLPDREQVIFIGRLQEAITRTSSEKEIPSTSEDGRAM